MGKTFPDIDERNAQFIRDQHVFFVATAPRAADGLLNLSPKGLDSFSILDPHTVAYLDLVGSGIETVAHLRENARIVILFCAFEGPPRLLRLHGRGDVVEPGDAEWDELAAHFPNYPGARSIIRVRLERISDSCGYGVPLYQHEGPRSQLIEWADRKGIDGIEAYKVDHNLESIDGLAGLRRTEESA
ncbi:MAG: pyridoxamine 5'-phosphate oxidase family protein [Deltaproteobacteria bacterium]|nr:MAG: pyridoxamine 5'-phosphate oxidase family protein [Deltaproteobacteria bacterium]